MWRLRSPPAPTEVLLDARVCVQQSRDVTACGRQEHPDVTQGLRGGREASLKPEPCQSPA